MLHSHWGRNIVMAYFLKEGGKKAATTAAGTITNTYVSELIVPIKKLQQQQVAFHKLNLSVSYGPGKLWPERRSAFHKLNLSV